MLTSGRPPVRQVGDRPGRVRALEISEPQKRTLAAISEHVSRKGIPPTLQELGRALNVATATVQDQVKQLVRKGYVRRTKHKARSLEAGKEPEIDVPGRVAVPT